MDIERNLTFRLPGFVTTGSKVTVKCIDETQLSIFGLNDEESQTILHLQPEVIFEDPVLRGLVAETNSIFLAVQDLKKHGNRVDYVTLSRSYRSVIRACLEKLQETRSETDDENQDQIKLYEYFIKFLYSIEFVWYLCEILLIELQPSNIIAPQLLDWNRFHIPVNESKAADFLLCPEDAHKSEDFWPVVKGLILQGQIHVARTLLQLHSRANKTQFRMAEYILKTMPVYSTQTGLSIPKFKQEWSYWSAETQSKLHAGELAGEPELEEIVELITGNENVWDEQIKKSKCCYDFFPGYIFYTEPGCKHYDLGVLANNWKNRWEKCGGDFRPLDNILLYLMENDMFDFLRSIQNMHDNKWFVTHLIDLLYNCGQLRLKDENQSNIAASIRDTLIFEYGATLMSRKSLWMVGLDYLEYCPDGFGSMESLLTRVNIKNERQAMKVIEIARRKNLPSVESEICKVQTTRSMEKKRYGNALEWAIRSKDNIMVTFIADFFLNYYSKEKVMLCPDLLSNIGAKMFISPRLVFLVKFFDFCQFYEDGQDKNAADLLVNLLDSKITPEYFWPSLLSSVLPLLKSDIPVIIPSKDTYVILHHLEAELVPYIEKNKKALANSNELPSYIEKMDNLVKTIRKACAKNLGRAIMMENSVLT